MEMSDDRFDTLAGGEQQGDELLARGRQMGRDTLAGGEQAGTQLLAGGEQMGRDTLAGGEQSGPDLLVPAPPSPAESRAPGDEVEHMHSENEDEDWPEHRSVA
jgi:hypothetical protein